jgi:hypothetical protein
LERQFSPDLDRATGFNMGNDWSSILHTAADQRSKVNSTSVYLGYRLALAVVYSIDKASCDAFR